MNPPPIPTDETIITCERLRLLAWGYYISGGLGALFACLFLVYALMFGAMSFIPESEWESNGTKLEEKQSRSGQIESRSQPNRRNDAPPVMVFRVIAVGMVFMTLFGWVLGGLTAYAGYCIVKRKHRMFTNIMAGYNVIWIPYGTILGVLTFIAINSKEAVRLYQEEK